MGKKSKDILILLSILIFSRLLMFSFTSFINGGFNLEHYFSWDSEFYLEIIESGYDESFPINSPKDVACNTGSGFCHRNFAFFPLYPILVKYIGDFLSVNYVLIGIIISNICFLLAGIAIFKIAKKLFKKKEISYLSTVFYAFFPFSYIFSSFMSESLFICLFAWAFYFALNKKYILAGILGCLLSASRNTGVLFMIPYILICFNYKWESGEIKENGKFKFKYLLSALIKDYKFLIGLILIPLGLIAFMTYLYFRTGDFLAFIHIQKWWDKPVKGLNPLFAIFYSLYDTSIESSKLIHAMNLCVLALIVFCLIYACLKMRKQYSLYSILFWILAPMSAGTLLALGRYAAVLFPIYIILAKFLYKKRVLLIFVLLISLLVFLYLSKLYTSDLWITV